MAESQRDLRLFRDAGMFIRNRMELLEGIPAGEVRKALIAEIEVMARVMQAAK